ncbi:MAG TPA: hypothetical protein VM733_14780, partial [Thermoanaerobaculia bacterium]|nr:hypothetical protein [Thermoanaerobaculia bacterium]
MLTVEQPGPASLLLSLIVLFTSIAPASAGIKGGRGTNGQHTRPFYIVAHNPNQLWDVDAALAAGANALEPDIMKFSDDAMVANSEQHVNWHAGPSGLFVY